MKVTVNGESVELNENATVLDALKKLSLNTEIFIVSRDNEIIHEHEQLRDKDRLNLIKVISGG